MVNNRSDQPITWVEENKEEHLILVGEREESRGKERVEKLHGENRVDFIIRWQGVSSYEDTYGQEGV